MLEIILVGENVICSSSWNDTRAFQLILTPCFRLIKLLLDGNFNDELPLVVGTQMSMNQSTPFVAVSVRFVNAPLPPFFRAFLCATMFVNENLFSIRMCCIK